MIDDFNMHPPAKILALRFIDRVGSIVNNDARYHAA